MVTVTVTSIVMGSARQAETMTVVWWTPGASLSGMAVTVARSPMNAEPASGVVPSAWRIVIQELSGVDNA